MVDILNQIIIEYNLDIDLIKYDPEDKVKSWLKKGPTGFL